MPVIRRVYNYNKVYLSPEVKFGSSALCGQTVDTIECDKLHKMPFLGFLDLASINQLNGAILTMIDGFTPGDYISGQWQELHRNDWLLGHADQSGVYLVTQHNKPIKAGFGPIQTPPKHVDNVRSIR